MTPEALVLGMVYIIIHLLANELIPANKVKRLKWLSFSGGLAVSYVFVYILPSLHREQQQLGQYGASLTMESELYFIGLLGLLLFFGIQKAVGNTQRSKRGGKWSFFWLEVTFFAVYNMLVAYIVISSNVTGVQALFYGTAIGLHFIAVAHDLWRVSPHLYNKIGRYIIASGILIGWFMGMLVSLSAFVESMIFAFISGAMILNVLNNELPKEKDAHFPSFAIGVLSYTTATLLLKYVFEW